MVRIRRSAALVLSLSLAACAGDTSDAGTSGETEAQLIERARGIHERVITLDTHDDINTSNFTAERNYTVDLPNTQVDLPSMEEGGLDVAWLIVYTGQGDLTPEGYAAAYENAIDKFDAIHRLAEEYAPDRVGLATSSQEVRDIVASGRKVVMIGVENAYPVGLDLDNIRDFAERGARYMSLSHNGHSQFADSNTGERDDVWLYGGLSDLGRQAIAELNRWGIMVDLSHPSKESNLQAIELSAAPVIASHSTARAMFDHSRNLSDEELLAIRDNGGVVQTVAFRSYVNGDKHAAWNEARQAILEEEAYKIGFEILPRRDVFALDEDARAAYESAYAEVVAAADARAGELEETHPPVSVTDVVDHIDYMVNLIGVDHVGISSDFDGGGGVTGWDDASETFNVTLELVRRGYSEEDIGKLWSGNLLRVLDEVQAIGDSIRAAG